MPCCRWTLIDREPFGYSHKDGLISALQPAVNQELRVTNFSNLSECDVRNRESHGVEISQTTTILIENRPRDQRWRQLANNAVLTRSSSSWAQVLTTRTHTHTLEPTFDAVKSELSEGNGERSAIRVNYRNTMASIVIDALVLSGTDQLTCVTD